LSAMRKSNSGRGASARSRGARRKPAPAGGASRAAARAPRAPAPPPPAPPPPVVAEPVAPEAPPLPDVPLAEPERVFAARVPPPEADRPFPSTRRAVFFDVENTSRAQHIARVIEHLAVDRRGSRTDFVAVGNWRVIGHDTARLLAQHGAQLVHSAPSVGVRDWSDLRIAVAAGVWLAGARPGDLVEIISDDRAFDAVGDVAAGLGIVFRRLSYRGLGGMARDEAPAPPAAEPEAERRGRRGRRGRGGRGRHQPAPGRHPAAPRPPVPAPEPLGDAAPSMAEAHTAPHDEIVNVVRDLVHRAPGRPVTLDSLANALKSRGFSRPPGSPRLITRLRRIRELAISRTNEITLVEDGGPPVPAAPLPEGPPDEARGVSAPAEERAGDEGGGTDGNRLSTPEEAPGEADGNRRDAGEPAPGPAPGRRRRTRRGGRGRRRRPPAGASAPA
jgi:hypothetical protein